MREGYVLKMPSYRKRPRKKSPPPHAGGGVTNNSSARGRGTIARARELRAGMTEAEKKLWEALRRKSLNGVRFRRQYPLGPYFADFVCLPARLIIEVDGSQHANAVQSAHDCRRTKWLQGENFRVLRFWNVDVLQNLDGVLESIDAAIRKTPPPDARTLGARPSAPSRKGRENDG